MSDAEVMNTALAAALYFRGNFETTRYFLQEQGYMPHMLSKSRFNYEIALANNLNVSMVENKDAWRMATLETCRTTTDAVYACTIRLVKGIR